MARTFKVRLRIVCPGLIPTQLAKAKVTVSVGKRSAKATEQDVHIHTAKIQRTTDRSKGRTSSKRQ